MLVSAQSQLREKLKAIKTDLVQAVLHSHIMAMLRLFNVFLNKGLTYTWRQASVLVAASEGQGTSRAQKIRAWVLTYLQLGQLPHYRYSWRRRMALDNENIAQMIQLEVQGRIKGGVIKAADVVNIVASSPVQDHLK
jgi:hypothetical protein